MSSVSVRNLPKSHAKWRLFLGFALVLLSLALFGALRLVVAEGDPRVTTDKADYLSNETVTITGSGSG